MAYHIDFTHQDRTGKVKFQRDLEGSHRLTLSDVGSPLDVSLEEIPPAGMDSTKTFRLTLTDGIDGPRSEVQGTWPYEIFFDHQRTDGVVDVAVLATGSHFTKMAPQTPKLEVALDNLPAQGTLDPRLHFVLKDTE